MQDLIVWRHRGGLRRTLEAIRRGSLAIGFVGGSITDGRPDNTWPEPVVAWFVENFPQARICVENAAIGATGSELAVFRAKRDLIDRGCHLVFIEFAVNDTGEPTERRTRTREGLIRKLLAGDGRDLILTYTFGQDHYNEMMDGKVPATIADFEQLAEYYRIGSVWMGLHSLREIAKGRLRWEEWLPDGVHPQNRGSLSYAQSVIAFLERELLSPASAGAMIPEGPALPPPLNPANWEHAFILPFSEVTLDGPWALRRWLKHVWIDQALATSAVGARLSFHFRGRGLTLAFDFGKTSAEFRYRLDAGEWKTSSRDRPGWVGDDGWYRTFPVADDLATGEHFFELEVVHGNAANCTGTNLRLGLIGVIP